MNRGDIYMACLDPTMGSEIRKTRPVLIIQNDMGCLTAQTFTVLPISSKPLKGSSIELLISKNNQNNLYCNSKICVHQIRTLDKKRFIKKIGSVNDSLLKKIELKLMFHLGVFV